MIWNKNYPACCNPMNCEESSRWSLILVASYDMPQRKAELLFYTGKKKTRTPRGFSKFKEFPNDKNVTKQKPFQRVEMENIRKQERQIVARYARLTPSCKAGACTGQNSSMKNNKGH